MLASSYATGFALFLFPGPGGLDWGWELVTLAEGLALVAYAVRRLEPGPGYLAFFVLVIFAMDAAAGGGGDGGGAVIDGSEPSRSLTGWPLAIAIGTAAATLWGLRAARRGSGTLQ